VERVLGVVHAAGHVVGMAELTLGVAVANGAGPGNCTAEGVTAVVSVAEGADCIVVAIDVLAYLA